MIQTLCKICGNDRFDFLYEGKDRLHFLEGKFDLYRCHRCRLIFVYPFLSEEELGQYYPKEYAPYAGLESGQDPPHGTRSKLFYYLGHPVKALNALIYSKILGHNRDFPLPSGSKVLDIGCGDGAYLVKKSGEDCECYGVDISADALKRLKEKQPAIHVFHGNLWEACFSDGFFDLVNLCHVLEHVPDMERLLSEIKRILKKNGRLRIQVPNAASLTFGLFGRFWIALDTPRHVYVFSRSNLATLLFNQGFRIKKERTIENSYDLVASSLYCLNAFFNRRRKLADLRRVWDSEWAKLLLSPYSLFVNSFKIGDTLEVVLEKR